MRSLKAYGGDGEIRIGLERGIQDRGGGLDGLVADEMQDRQLQDAARRSRDGDLRLADPEHISGSNVTAASERATVEADARIPKGLDVPAPIAACDLEKNAIGYPGHDCIGARAADAQLAAEGPLTRGLRQVNLNDRARPRIQCGVVCCRDNIGSTQRTLMICMFCPAVIVKSRRTSR